jgi:hypothetical protein
MLPTRASLAVIKKPSDQIIDLAAWCGNLVTLEIALKSIPTQIATAPIDPLVRRATNGELGQWPGACLQPEDGDRRRAALESNGDHRRAWCRQDHPGQFHPAHSRRE